MYLPAEVDELCIKVLHPDGRTVKSFPVISSLLTQRTDDFLWRGRCRIIEALGHFQNRGYVMECTVPYHLGGCFGTEGT